jgi:hypothetical protein
VRLSPSLASLAPPVDHCAPSAARLQLSGALLAPPTPPLLRYTGAMLAAGGDDNCIRVVDVTADNEVKHTISDLPAPVRSLAYDPKVRLPTHPPLLFARSLSSSGRCPRCGVPSLILCFKYCEVAVGPLEKAAPCTEGRTFQKTTCRTLGSWYNTWDSFVSWPHNTSQLLGLRRRRYTAPSAWQSALCYRLTTQ